MENGSEIEEKVSVLNGESLVNSNGSVHNGDDHSFGIADEKSVDIDLPEAKPVDYTGLTKKDFVGLLKEAATQNDFKKADELIRDIKPLFDEVRLREKSEALVRFKEEGGKEDDFLYKGDEWDVAFDIYLKSIRDNRQRHFKEIEEQKNTNLLTKNEILERLRHLVDGEDTEHSLRQFKEIQKEWKTIGQVPQAHIKTLWANYNALMDRFYDQRSIYFELKELDRKKNLELKIDLVARAEKLLGESKIAVAVKELNELHNEFRHVGPVPAEEKENVWQKFKTASDAVYAKRDEFVAGLQEEFQKNLESKEKLNEELAAFAAFQSESIKEWNQKTKEIIEVQKKWETVGGVPRSKVRETNKKFWGSFKQFFQNKNVFFKKLDEERSNNLKLKTDILNRAIELKESKDWEKASNELKELQANWREIGTVPEKHREKIFQQFKEACDYFFEQRRQSTDKEAVEQNENLVKKEAIIGQLEKIAEEKNGSLHQVKDLQGQFMAIGFVPKRAVNALKSRFSEVLTKAIEALPDLGAEEKGQAAFEARLSNIKQGPQGEKKIHNKEHHLRKQIAKAENDIATLRNNLEFFGRSKNAEKMKEEFGARIKQADEEIVHLKKQLQMLQASA
ncbi:MAG TPA: DUF349 domain-containing protein [Cyclobacteriaceae bacterium]|jgi:hypothetical protein|nr:DUF349 domain-containing protein [Cyclobacteriaceae bacterium]